MTLRGIRRALHVGGGAACGAIACAAVAYGGVDGGGAPAPRLWPVMLYASIGALACAAVARRVRFEPPSERAQRVSAWLRAAEPLADAEVALSLAAGVYAVLAATGSLTSPLYPLVYGVVAFTVTFQRRAAVWTTLVAVFALEIAAFLRAPVAAEAAPLAIAHLVFVAAAAAAHAVFLRGLIDRQRRRARARLAHEVTAQRESARDYRLIAAALGAKSRAPRSRDEEERLLTAGGVQSIHGAMFFILDLVKRSLDCRTVALVWVDDDGGKLKLKEVISDADDLVEQPILPPAGVLGALRRDRAPLVVAQTRPGQIPYYAEDRATSFAGVPVMDGPHMRGLLCADRDAPFGDADIGVLSAAAAEVLRAIQAEQVFLSVERAKYEHERFYQASAMLVSALTLEQVMETAFDAAAQIAEYDVAAISLYDRDKRKHRVYSVRQSEAGKAIVKRDQLAALEYRDNAGLVAMVVKNRHFLPAGGEHRDVTAPVYVRRVKLKGAESLLVLPLLVADEAIGAFVLASRKEHQFPKDVRDMLGIIANQVAVSLQNGLMYKKMETMATTDGLTGLTNHRTFQERFEDLLARAARHDHEAAVLLTDVDHFKKVNDNYGHPVGDEVLRRVARVLMDSVRKIDITARYGGEEFAVVLEATGEEGAKAIAERIREDVGKLVIDSDKGPFTITMSIGVACFPRDARDRATLIERADHALYHAKESGRNRVVTYQEFVAARRARRAG